MLNDASSNRTGFLFSSVLGFLCDLRRGRRGSDQCQRVCGLKRAKEKRVLKFNITLQLTR